MDALMAEPINGKPPPPKLFLPEEVAGIYAIEHLPSKGMYIGSTRNVRQVHQSWYYRLAHIDTMPMLNWAVRSIYTTRQDFVFHLLATLANDALFLHNAMVMEAKVKERIASKGKEFVLNCDNSAATREYWVSRTPYEERDYRFRKLANAKPVPIVPFQNDPNDLARVVRDAGDTAARALVPDSVRGQSLEEANRSHKFTAEGAVIPVQPGKVTLIPGKFQENALGSAAARSRHIRYLTDTYNTQYSEQCLLTDVEVWTCWESTLSIDNSVQRLNSTINAMRDMITTRGNNG